MRVKKFSPDYVTAIKYVLLFAAFAATNKLEKTVMPYSAAIYAASIAFGYSAFFSSAIWILSFLVFKSTGLLAYAGIVSAFFIAVSFVYKKLGVKPRYEIVLFATVAAAVFCFLGDTINYVPIEKRVTVAAITVLLTLVAYVAIKGVTEKGLKFKPCFDEYATAAVLFTVIGTGVCNALSPFVWKSVCVLLILLSAYLYRQGVCTVFAAVCGISFSVYYGNVSYASVYLCMGVFAESVTRFSRYLSAATVLAADYLAERFFGVYGAYALTDFISCFIGAAIFCITPSFLLKNLKERLCVFREKQLSRVSINRNRTFLSNRLYELSGVFTEMSDALSAFKKTATTEDKARICIVREIMNAVCKNCDNYYKCKENENKIAESLNVLTGIGFAKGKLSLIDLPKELSVSCVRPNNLLYGLNKLLSDYRGEAINNANVCTGRKLIADEAKNVSEILKKLALESGTLLKYRSDLERKLSAALLKAGYPVHELLIYGEDSRLCIGMILSVKEIELGKLITAVEKTVGTRMALTEKSNVTEEKCYLSFRIAAPYDAFFGLAAAKKDGSEKSGDTHSVTRISDDRFLVALSDGMGSGEQANRVSSVTLSLIESFYKAGMKSELILGTVAKLLAITAEETFTALDVSVIDLKNCTADFIKYGAPYGFIVGENGIRIVESNSLPLGILDELKPSVATAKLAAGDMVILVTDGIADAFGSPTDLAEFLRTLPALNPQTLADDVMKRALSLTDGKREDDMTVLAVRIFKKKPA